MNGKTAPSAFLHKQLDVTGRKRYLAGSAGPRHGSRNRAFTSGREFALPHRDHARLVVWAGLESRRATVPAFYSGAVAPDENPSGRAGAILAGEGSGEGVAT